MSDIVKNFKSAKDKIKAAVENNTTANLSHDESKALYSMIDAMEYVEFSKSKNNPIAVGP